MKSYIYKYRDRIWLHVVDPNKQELDALGVEYGLDGPAIRDCLESEHLPKFELQENTGFAILRLFDNQEGSMPETIQGFTRKVAIFINSRIIITIVRAEHQLYSSLIKQHCHQDQLRAESSPLTIVLDLTKEIIKTYRQPIAESLESFDRLEASIFRNSEADFSSPQKAYYLKRKIVVIKRILWMMIDPLKQASQHTSSPVKDEFISLSKGTQRQVVQLEELHENLNTLISLQLSLASNRTNEVMRNLTILSIFFMPLNFIAGVYGMNFDLMPELHWKFGYPWALILMITSTVIIYSWFRWKRWFRISDLD